jgi:hypothetical protein
MIGILGRRLDAGGTVPRVDRCGQPTGRPARSRWLPGTRRCVEPAGNGY